MAPLMWTLHLPLNCMHPQFRQTEHKLYSLISLKTNLLIEKTADKERKGRGKGKDHTLPLSSMKGAVMGGFHRNLDRAVTTCIMCCEILCKMQFNKEMNEKVAMGLQLHTLILHGIRRRITMAGRVNWELFYQ